MKTANGERNFPVQQPVFKQIAIVMMGAAALLMVPLVAMQFTNEVVWTMSDFVIVGVLLVGTGLLYVLFSRMVKTRGQRLAVGAVLLVLFLLIYVELAVGLFGSPWAGS
jgi:hypothetical protein